MSAPGTRDLIRLGITVIAGTALGVGAASQFGQSIDVKTTGPWLNMGYCAGNDPHYAAGLAYATSHDSHTIDATSVSVVSPNNLITAPSFYLVDKADDKGSFGGTAQKPFPAVKHPHQILPGHQVAIMVELSDPKGYGTLNALKVGLKDGAERENETIPTTFAMGDPAHNAMCAH